MIRWLVLCMVVAAAACGGRNAEELAPEPEISEAALDSLWATAEYAYRHGEWGDVIKRVERFLLEFTPGDPRAAKAHYYLGEAHLGQGNRLEAAREFRKASDDTPDDPIAPDALLRVADAYAEMWRRPELDPTYGQTAIATYEELINRYPGTSAAKRAQARIAELKDQFAYKAYKAALYYYRLKAYDSAILYLKDLVATYPRAPVAPAALVKLVEAYQKLGYREDVQETCGYMRRFHPRAPRVAEVCPTT